MHQHQPAPHRRLLTIQNQAAWLADLRLRLRRLMCTYLLRLLLSSIPLRHILRLMPLHRRHPIHRRLLRLCVTLDGTTDGITEWEGVNFNGEHILTDYSIVLFAMLFLFHTFRTIIVFFLCLHKADFFY